MHALWNRILVWLHLRPRDARSAVASPDPVAPVTIGLIPPPSGGTAALPSYDVQATRIAFSTLPLNLAAIGATAVVRAVVLDQEDLPVVPQPAIAYSLEATGIVSLAADPLVPNLAVITAVSVGTVRVIASVTGLPDAMLVITVKGAGGSAAALPFPFNFIL